MTQRPQRAVGHGAALSVFKHTTPRARAGCAWLSVLRTHCVLELVAPEVRPPLPSLTHVYDSVHLATELYRLHMLYCVRPLSGAASGGTNAHAYWAARAPYRLFCTILQSSDIKLMHMTNHTHDRCALLCCTKSIRFGEYARA